ncbi:MAG: hypothetical protein CMK92_04685 [Pseudomonas sp.]|nr:hypothetical protein [Pseudomonas sp.]
MGKGKDIVKSKGVLAAVSVNMENKNQFVKNAKDLRFVIIKKLKHAVSIVTVQKFVNIKNSNISVKNAIVLDSFASIIIIRHLVKFANLLFNVNLKIVFSKLIAKLI